MCGCVCVRGVWTCEGGCVGVWVCEGEVIASFHCRATVECDG